VTEMIVAEPAWLAAAPVIEDEIVDVPFLRIVRGDDDEPPGRLARALSLAELGFDVLSVWSTTPEGTCRCVKGKDCDRKPGKHPTAPDGKWHETHDPERIRTLLSAGSEPNYGVIPPAGAFALDLDGTAIARIERLTAEHGPLPVTYEHRTRNGRHVFLRWPSSVDRPRNANLFGIVTRWSNGSPSRGYVVGPGSRVGDFLYTSSGDPGELATLPEAWARAALAHASGPRQALGDVQVGQRHIELRDAARYLQGRGFDGAALRAAVDVINGALPDPKTQAEVDRAIGQVAHFAIDDDVAIAPLIGERPVLRPVSSIEAPVDLDDALVDGMFRKGTITVHATVEGLGKTRMAGEIAIRCASGVGSVFGRYPVRRRLRVAIIDEENGEAQLWREETAVMAALGVPRASLGGLFRVSFAGLHLARPESQAWLLEQLRLTRPDLVIIDTGGMVVDEEWGPALKDAIRFLRRVITELGCAFLILVHLTKEARGRQPGASDRLHGTAIGDVMGQWSRHVDVVMVAADLGADRVRLSIRKRIEPSTVILAKGGGLWNYVADADAPAARESADDRILRAIAAGAETADEIREGIGADGRALAKRTFYDGLRRLRLAGFVADGTPLRLTDSGVEAVA
jgi:hypothetical protein